MSRMCLTLTITAVVPCMAQVSTISESMWETAERQIVRPNPAAFPELPKNVLAALQQRDCTIPQVPMIDGRHNVIEGAFLKPGQTDWAVLCSVGRTSTVLVFWDGSGTNPAKIAVRGNVDRLQSWGGDMTVYSSAIRLVNCAALPGSGRL